MNQKRKIEQCVKRDGNGDGDGDGDTIVGCLEGS